MTSKRKIITFSGRMRSGKDMLCKTLENELGAKTLSMATQLKKLCCGILEMELPMLSPWDEEKLNLWKNNRGFLSEDGLQLCEETIQMVAYQTGFCTEDVFDRCLGVSFRNVRELLQLIGTEVIRSIDPSWHIRKTLQAISELPEDTIACVDDIRFQNELKAFRDAGADSFFIIRTNAENVSNHESENTLHHSDFPDNRVIINNGDPETLCRNFIKIISNGFGTVSGCQMFLSDYPKYRDVKRDFGVVQTPLVDEIIRQNKDRDMFTKDGLIAFRNNTAFKIKDVLEEMDIVRSYSYEQIGGRFVIDNPIAYENLKRWL